MLALCISASSPSWSGNTTRPSASSWTYWASSSWRILRPAPTTGVPGTPLSGGTEEDVITDAANLRIPFSLRGISGLTTVSVTRNTDPDAIGYSLLTGGLSTDPARGFPVCRATVTYPAEGYAAMFGWTQMVRSTDSAPDRFEMDPIALYQQIPTAYAWFGVRPELFDAPARGSRYDMVLGGPQLPVRLT